MKKMVLLALAMLAVFVSLSYAEMSADEVLGKYLAAVGGEQKMRAVKSVFTKGSMFMQGMPLDLKVWVVPPDKHFSQVLMNNVAMGGSGSNGKDAWVTQMGQTYLLSGEMKKRTLDEANLFTLLDYKKKGYKTKFLGEDLVKGAKAYKVEVVDNDNDTTVYYFDATTFYTVKMKKADGTVTMSDHRKVADLVFPFKINSQSNMGQQMITFDSIAVNGTVPDSVFVLPKDAQPYEVLQKMIDSAKAAAGKAGGGGQ